MSDTNTLLVDQVTEDELLAVAILKYVSHTERRWFAYIMPILRSNINGVQVMTLCKQLGLPEWHSAFYSFIHRLCAANVTCRGRPGNKRLSLDDIRGPVRLTVNTWLKEMARTQAQRHTEYTLA